MEEKVKYSIYENGGKKMIARLNYPRFVGQIVRKGKYIELEGVRMIDDETDVRALSRIMREAGDYLAKNPFY